MGCLKDQGEGDETQSFNARTSVQTKYRAVVAHSDYQLSCFEGICEMDCWSQPFLNKKGSTSHYHSIFDGSQRERPCLGW